MTMVPAHTLSKLQLQQQQQHAGGACGAHLTTSINLHHPNGFRFLDQQLGYHHHLLRGLAKMADEEDSATNTNTNSTTNETGSTSNTPTSFQKNHPSPHPHPHLRTNEDAGEAGSSWLQLGIGGGSRTPTPTVPSPHNNNNNNNNNQQDLDLIRPPAPAPMLELNLLLGGPTTTTRSPALLPPPQPTIFLGRPSIGGPGGGEGSSVPIMFYQSHHHIQQLHQQADQHQLGWANYLSRSQAMANPRLLAMASSSSSTSAPYFLQPRPSPVPFHLAGAGPPPIPDVVRPIDPPRRPHSGIWFTLQASLNQAKEPFLPQLPKNYLRIKDGRMTVGLLIKYLVNKLGLESESEVEIRCRGQELEPNLTMQQVRDEIWSGREAVGAGGDHLITFLPNSSTVDHVMLLHYSRSS